MKLIQEAREQFKYLKSDKKYFNHAAISPLPDCVKERIDNYVQIRTETEIEPFYQTLSEAKGAKEKLSGLLGVDPKLISWCSNVSAAFNILAQGLRWEKGDEIILNDLEFPSNVYPFLNLRKQGVVINFAVSRNGIIDVHDIEKLVTRKTKLISISMVQFLSGYRADLSALGNLCKDKNIIFCVDGIQGLGAVQINLKECNIDFFAGGTHKWLMALQGLGYFYISPNLLNIIEQKNVGWTSVKNPWELLNYDLDLLDEASRFELGTLPRIAIIALNASLSLFDRIGIDRIEYSILQNTIYLREKLINKGYELILKEAEIENLAGIISFKHNKSDKIFRHLEENKIICSLREGVIRISPHFYNTTEELDFLIYVLKDIVVKI